MSESPTAERQAFRGDIQFGFDNTSLSIFKDCPRKYQLAVIQGWSPKTKAPPLLFGGWMHAALEVYDREIAQGTSHQASLRAAVRFALNATCVRLDDGTFQLWTSDDPNRTRKTLVRSIIWYCEHFKEDALQTYILPDGKPALELSFRFKLPTSFESYYSGHIDKIAHYGSHGLYIQERKHSKQTLGSYYFDKYTPNSQVTGYIFAGHMLIQQPVLGAVIDAVQVAVNFSRPVRGLVDRSPDVLDEWVGDTVHWVEQIRAASEAKVFPMNTESCHSYNGCQFRGVCGKHPGVRQMVLETDFVKRFWDPLKVRTGEEP